MQKIDLNGKTILVTGSPGFIGATLVIRLFREMAEELKRYGCPTTPQNLSLFLRKTRADRQKPRA